MTAPERVEDLAEVHLYGKRGISLVRGVGAYLWDETGRRYLDAMSNYGVNVLGHAHPDVNRAVIAQLGALTNCHQSFYSDARAAFESKLMSILPDRLSRLAYANSGTEANEAAIKFARLATGRHRIISATDGYHGRTLGSLSVTGVAKYRENLEPLLDGCKLVPFDDVPALAGTIAGAAAVMLEPIQGESGVHIPAQNYLTEVRRMCDESGALLILDEIQTGIGRTGTFLASQKSGVVPDILSLSKGIANGLPMGVTVVTDAVAEKIPTGSHGGTFSGNPLVCVAATATVRTVGEDRFLNNVNEVGDSLLTDLRSIAHPMIREVRGRGLMIAIELKTRITPLLRALQDNGVLALPAGPRAVRFLPPLILTGEQGAEISASVKRSMEQAYP